jgi:arylsulfatase A-like enzyme
VLFARGPGIAPGSRTDGTSVNDITPTVLAWLGLPLGLDFEGRPGNFLDPPRQQPQPIASHDTGRIERLDATTSGSEAEIFDQLRALGYIH